MISFASSLIKSENKIGLRISPCFNPRGHINSSEAATDANPCDTIHTFYTSMEYVPETIPINEIKGFFEVYKGSIERERGGGGGGGARIIKTSQNGIIQLFIVTLL